MNVELTNEEVVSDIESLLGDDLETLETPAVEPEVEPVEESEESTDEVEEEEDQEEEAEEEETQEEDPEVGITDDTLVDIQIGEETYEVNFAELRDGYLRNEDFVSRVRQQDEEHAARMAELEMKEGQLADELRMASVIVTSDLSRFDSINWEALKATDPAKYQELKLQAMEAKEQAASLENRRRQVQALHNKAQELKHRAYLNSQVEIVLRAIPEFKDKEFQKSLIDYGKSVGYTEEEILGMADARHLLLLNNSRLQAQGVVKKKEAMASKVAKDLPPVNKPGATKPKSSTDRQVVKSARARLSSERSVDAAAAYLMTFDFDK